MEAHLDLSISLISKVNNCLIRIHLSIAHRFVAARFLTQCDDALEDDSLRPTNPLTDVKTCFDDLCNEIQAISRAVSVEEETGDNLDASGQLVTTNSLNAEAAQRLSLRESLPSQLGSTSIQFTP